MILKRSQNPSKINLQMPCVWQSFFVCLFYLNFVKKCVKQWPVNILKSVKTPVFLQWKCICIIFYMMLRVAMSSTKNVLDFGLIFLSKTCLWGLIKLSLFDVMFLYQFSIKFGSILTALDTQNPSKVRGDPWSDGLQSLANLFPFASVTLSLCHNWWA